MLFFIPPAKEGDVIRLSDEEQRHLYALRPRIGDKLTLSDGENYTFDAEITAADKKGFSITLGKASPIEKEESRTTLFLALLKGEKIETVIQKCTEIGISRIVLFSSANCVVSAKGKEDAKISRYEKVARMAAMQCGSPLIPKIEGILTFNQAVEEMKNSNGVFFYEKAEYLLSQWLAKNDSYKSEISFMTGPEGGFTPEEAQKILDSNIPSLSLGKRILRAETAPICALSVIKAYRGEI